jgi:hypothetical protein
MWAEVLNHEQCKLVGNAWHHDGQLSNGQAIEEVWERVEEKE